MEETPNPTSQEAGRAVLGPVMWHDCLRLVIAPRIAEAVRGNPDIENRQQLHRAFCEMHGVKPSYSTFSGWCEDLGINFRKRIEVTIPGWREMPRPSPDFQGPMPVERVHTVPVAMISPEGTHVIGEPPADPDAPVEWDTKPTPREADMSSFNDGMPDILPGGFRAPTFFGSNDYAN